MRIFYHTFIRPMLRLAQISDLHLGGYAGAYERAKRILAHAKDCDIIALTGDIAHNAYKDAYTFVTQHAPRARVILLPGNHDCTHLVNENAPYEAWQRCGVPKDARLARFGVIETPFWQLVFLDTARTGCDEGHLTRQSLTRIARIQDKDILVFGHHPIFNVGAAWIDAKKLKQSQGIRAQLRTLQVKGWYAGHVHQEFETQKGGVHFATAPGADVQFECCETYQAHRRQFGYTRFVIGKCIDRCSIYFDAG